MELKARPPEGERYIVRFETPGHRERLKAIAAREKRSLNKQILLLIEAGEAATQPQGATR